MEKPIQEYMLAGLLRGAGVPFVGSRIGDAGRVEFVFANGRGETDKALADHAAGKLKVPTDKALSALLLVKSELFSMKRAMSGGSWQ